jgi:hypothetical protein
MTLSVFQVVSSLQLLGSKRGIRVYFYLVLMRATFPAHFIVLRINNVTTEKECSEPKRINMFYIHVIQSYLYLNTVFKRVRIVAKSDYLLCQVCPSVLPSARKTHDILYLERWGGGGGGTEICRENSILFKIGQK